MTADNAKDVYIFETACEKIKAVDVIFKKQSIN